MLSFGHQIFPTTRCCRARWLVLVATLGTLATLLTLGAPANASDWPRFRGPNGSGTSPDADPAPVTWSTDNNLKWQVALPGPGSSSPIVVGERVFVTCWTGYGTDEARDAQQDRLRRHLICFDRRTGEQIWSQAVEPVLPEDTYGGMFAQHGYASHTPVSDGEHVYVYFGKSGAMAFDMQGEQLWQTGVGTESDPRGWGSASSPILSENVLIVTASAESEALVGLDKQTGKELWRREASGLSGTWGTPILVPVDDQRTDLVLGVPFEIWGFNPQSGKFLWLAESVDSDSMCSSVVAVGTTVFAVEGRSGGSIAVRAGGAGNVTDSHVVWSGRNRNRIGTPVVVEDRIYFFSNGVANCISAKDGSEVFSGRLESPSASASQSAPQGFGGRGGRGGGMGGQDYASPVAADGKIYYVSRSGITYVLSATDKLEQLAANSLADGGDFSATPAISQGQLFIRSSKHLYCIASTDN